MTAVDASSLRFDDLVAREWLIANGLGGYSSSTICCLNTRKYHGLLVAALAPPVRRMVLLSRVEETIHHDGRAFDLAANEYPGTVHPEGHRLLRAFNHSPFPRWAYQGDGWTIEKQLRPILGENTVLLTYSLLGGDKPVTLELRPLFALRGIHELMYQWNARLDAQNLDATHHRLPPTSRSPEVFFAHHGQFTPQPSWYLNTIYRQERDRGYAGLEDLWMPGIIRWTLSPGQSAHFVCSTEPIDLLDTINRAAHQFDRTTSTAPPDPRLVPLLAAAEHFVARAHDGRPALMSGYPWPAPSGRDAMICLPGLLLVSGQMNVARELLLHFAESLRDGLMPSQLAEDGSGYCYTAADTSLWFINAVHAFARYGGDETVIQSRLLPAIDEIINSYRQGTNLGIRADDNGLIRSGLPDVPTTWMDAKLGDVVVTPRVGRTVSINALWYSGLRIAAEFNLRFGNSARANDLLQLATQCRDAFNRLFWNEAAGCCFDVVEDTAVDISVRPNQVFAISLPYSVLDPARQKLVLHRLRADLLTPHGLRTLAPGSSGYYGKYSGPPTTRDQAHHNGSAFPWLLGPYVSAFIRINSHNESAREEAQSLLETLLGHLTTQGTGHLPELFDGDEPAKPGGAVSSARSIAELLRAYAEDILDIAPPIAVPNPDLPAPTPILRPDRVTPAVPDR